MRMRRNQLQISDLLYHYLFISHTQWYINITAGAAAD